jgi:hypothetical protein
LASAWPRSLTHPNINRQADQHKQPRQLKSQAKQRSWTDQDGTEHQVTEIDAEEIGPSLRWATATLTRTNGPSRKTSPSPA